MPTAALRLARVSSQKLSLYSVFCIRRRSVIQGCNAATLNLNKQRRADKTSGRKHPRAGDVDIVPAGDVNGDVATALTATITANQQQQ